MTWRGGGIALDEFQHVIKQGGEHAERQIRAAVQTHRHVGYVFAGSATRMLADMTSDPGRAFYKMGARLFLGLIPRDEFTVFLRGGFDQAGCTVDDAALVCILELTHDVPYSVQRLAHECWEGLRVDASESTAGEATPLTVDRVERALVRVLQQEDAAYTQIWNSLKLQQKRALKAAVVEDGHALLSSDVSRRHKVPTGSMQKALVRLEP